MSRILRTFVCLLLICCILVNLSPLRAEATAAGAVGPIITGTSGLALSVPEVAILLLAAFGVYYTVENVDAIGDSLARSLELQAEYEEMQSELTGMQLDLLADWWTKSQTGAIDLLSAPSWILDTVKDWALGFIQGTSYVEIPMSGVVASGTVFSSGQKYIFSGGQWIYAKSACTLIKCNYISNSGVHRVLVGFLSESKFKYTTSQLGMTYDAGSFKVDGQAFYLGSWDMPYNDIDGAGSYNLGTGFTTGSSALVQALIAAYVGGSSDISSTTVESYPDVITGGIVNQLNSGVAMTVIGLPDVVVPGADLLPVDPTEYEDEAAAVTDCITSSLIAGDLTWEEYWDLIGVYGPTTGTAAPTVTLENTEAGTVAGTYELTDTGVGAVTVPSAVGDYTMDLSKFFPFCIPFDLYDFFCCLNADPVAPVIEWVIPLPGGDTYPLELDLSTFDPVAQLLRRLQLLLFCVGLAFKTRDLIKG